QMDLRFFHLNNRAACVRQIVKLFIERIAERHDSRRQIFVVRVLNSERHKFRRYRTELQGLGGHSLCSLKKLRVLKLSAADRPYDLRHDTGFEVVMKNMSTRESDAAGSGPRQFRNVAIKTRHVIRGIARPALT